MSTTIYKAQDQIIKKLIVRVKKEFAAESTGHDWWHVKRVWTMAKWIVKEEKAKVNLFVVEASALLHDIADWKFHQGDQMSRLKKTRVILKQLAVDEKDIIHVSEIINNVSFKGAGVATIPETLEGKIVQDADRLDALGAVGIARAFAYGGAKGRPLYEPTVTPQVHRTFQEYKTKQTTTINHFYEKLLLLKDRLHTKTAKTIAKSRHRFMEEFLRKFYEEVAEPASLRISN